MDPDKNICRIKREFDFYDAYDETKYIYKLWEFGITQWHDVVYTERRNSLKPRYTLTKEKNASESM